MSEESRQHLTAGIDPGASAVKVVIMRSQAGAEGDVLATAMQRMRRRNIGEVASSAFQDACTEAGIQSSDLDYVASTGDGEAVSFRTGHFYSMTTHARGALFLEPETRTVLDMGALHARAIAFDDRGKVLRHKMTSQCASGSGQFLENIARYLGVPLDDVGRLSMAADDPEACSSICAVLAETDVINMVSRGISTENILKGIHLSIAGKLVRLLRAITKEGVMLVSGGLAADEGFVNAIRESLESGASKTDLPLEVRSNPDSIYAGAIGAALLGAYRYDQLEKIGRVPAA